MEWETHRESLTTVELFLSQRWAEVCLWGPARTEIAARSSFSQHVRYDSRNPPCDLWPASTQNSKKEMMIMTTRASVWTESWQKTWHTSTSPSASGVGPVTEHRSSGRPPAPHKEWAFRNFWQSAFLGVLVSYTYTERQFEVALYKYIVSSFSVRCVSYETFIEILNQLSHKLRIHRAH